MTASAQPQGPQPQAESATMAGFSANRARRRTGPNPGAPGQAAQDEEQARNAAGQNPNQGTGPRNNFAGDQQGPDLGDQFNQTNFLALLAKLYGIPEIPTPYIATLREFKLDPDKGPQTAESGVLYAKVGYSLVEITPESVLTSSPVTPQLAYQMAVAAKANPNYEALTLSGSPEDRIMLFLAAQHMGLEIDMTSLPDISRDEVGVIARKFQVFERHAGLDQTVSGEYIREPAAAPGARPQPQPESDRVPPTFSGPAFA